MNHWMNGQSHSVLIEQLRRGSHIFVSKEPNNQFSFQMDSRMDEKDRVWNQKQPQKQENPIKQIEDKDLFIPVGYPDQWKKYSQNTQSIFSSIDPSDMTPFFRKANRKSKAYSREELQALFKEFQGYAQTHDHLQNKELHAQEVVYSRHYFPESLIAITIRPTAGGRCHVICRNIKGEILVALSNIRELKRYRKISAFIEDKPKIILMVNDYCLTQNRESLAILQLISDKVDFCLIHMMATSSFMHFSSSLSPLDQIIYSPSQTAQFQAFSSLRDDLGLFECPIWTKKFEGYGMGSSWYSLKTKSMCLMSESVARIPIIDWLNVLGQVVELENQQNRLLQQWRGARQPDKRVIMFQMMVVNYNRRWGQPIQQQFIKKMELDLTKPSQDSQPQGSPDEHYPKLVGQSRKCIQCRRVKKKKSSKWICIGCTLAIGKRIHLCLECMAKFHRPQRRIPRLKRNSKVKNHNKKMKIIRKEKQRSPPLVKVEESVDLRLLGSQLATEEYSSQHGSLCQQQTDSIYRLEKATEKIFSLIRQRIAAREKDEAQRLLHILLKSCAINLHKLKQAQIRSLRRKKH